MTRESTTDTRTHWLARAALPDGPRWIRVTTDGAPPGPHDRAGAIADPFADPDGDPYGVATGPAHDLGPLADLTQLPPLPGKVVCVGRNYRAHAAELGNEVPSEPLLFFKPSSCLAVHGAALALPRGYERIDMEAELVVVVGRRGKSIDPAAAWQHIAGYALGNDISNRDLQKRDKQWTRAKGFDGFGPVGPWLRLTAPGFVLPAADIHIRGHLDGKLVQDAALSDMVFDIPAILAYISATMTLLPGDLIFTGTPEGVSALRPGCTTRVDATGFELGALDTPVT
jgi:2-keto-4-pentenoate hydratase/2-oxohepta-3-ene-1,7-dioic acid hydratase in catechol pathway